MNRPRLLANYEVVSKITGELETRQGQFTSESFLHNVYFWSSRSSMFMSDIVQLYTSRNSETLPGVNIGHTSSWNSSS